ncbi:MAG: 6-phosphofructokinase [Paracholeplasma sp.]|jgi:6-phosphofructokinase 1|uniref:ATP-dependent 6-phosphofructokinase n=1 Tax=Acholeplasma brassicae TaxID=61635 RepID=U4KS40_9MOLU|nr:MULTISPECIES: 6-phosphofructokinase [Paracholeplasma]MDY3195289.1 6-phosphofructokinase [Paracholeplasma sp.]CCV66298.1 6-phosphofructokinase [Paracholeplasma brassicae]HBT60004.1 6-phosphofructokinase [Acholeplasmataceae bacterium]
MRIAVLTSGGDAPGMNSAIRAVVRAGLYYGIEVYGVYDGYRGLVAGNFEKMTRKSVSEILSRGGTVLGTARMTSFQQKEVREIAIENLRKEGIEALIVIGGDGSYKGALALNEMGFPTIGVPGTIDNDLGGTDYTIGFHTALATIVDAVDKLRDTASSHQRCSIVETMGRHCGDLAIAAGLSCGAEFIITPEHPMDKEKMIENLKKHKLEGRRNAIIMITENTTNVYELAQEISERSGFACRATVLGYVQRGGSPVAEDRILAGRMGAYAVELIKQGISGVAVGVSHNDLVYMPYEKALDRDRGSMQDLYELIGKIS